MDCCVLVWCSTDWTTEAINLISKVLRKKKAARVQFLQPLCAFSCLLLCAAAVVVAKRFLLLLLGGGGLFDTVFVPEGKM